MRSDDSFGYTAIAARKPSEIRTLTLRYYRGSPFPAAVPFQKKKMGGGEKIVFGDEKNQVAGNGLLDLCVVDAATSFSIALKISPYAKIGFLISGSSPPAQWEGKIHKD